MVVEPTLGLTCCLHEIRASLWKFPLIPTIGRHDIGIQMLGREESPLWSGTRGPGKGWSGNTSLHEVRAAELFVGALRLSGGRMIRYTWVGLVLRTLSITPETHASVIKIKAQLNRKV